MRIRFLALITFIVLMATMMAQSETTSGCHPPGIKIHGVFPVPRQPSKAGARGTAPLQNSSLQKNMDLMKAEMGVVGGTEQSRGAIVPPAGSVFPQPSTVLNKQTIEVSEPYRAGSDSDLPAQRMKVMGYGDNPESRKRRETMIEAQGLHLGILVENVGSREIKAIEWQYPYRNCHTGDAGSSTSTGSEMNWRKMVSKVNIKPQEAAFLLPDEFAPRIVGKRQDHLGDIQITRVVYKKGPDWKAD